VFETDLLHPYSGSSALKKEAAGTSKMLVPIYEIIITVQKTVVCINLSSSQIYKMNSFMSIKYFSAETSMYLANCLLSYLHRITLASQILCLLVTLS